MKIRFLKVYLLAFDSSCIDVLCLECICRINGRQRGVNRSFLFVQWYRTALPSYAHFEIFWLPVGLFVYRLLNGVKKGQRP